MKFSENDNIYEFNALNVLEEYAEFVEGSPECMVVACSGEAVSDNVRRAVVASCEKLDLGECAWVASQHLSPQDLFRLVEGLDPVALIAVDDAAASALGKAYGCDMLLNERNRVFGRTCIAFRDFAGMLADPHDKQRAWALLKRLR